MISESLPRRDVPPAPTLPAQVVSPKEGARRLSISLRTMRTLIASRAIPVIRVSPRRLGIHEDDLAAYLVRQREAP